MKLTCDSQALSEAFLLAASAAPTRSPKDILLNVKLTATESVLSIHATNLEVGINVDVPIEGEKIVVESPGAVLLPVARFGSIMREWTEEKVTIEVEQSGESHVVRVYGGRSRYKLPYANPDEFPAPKAMEDTKGHVVASRELLAALRRTIYAIDDKSSRYALGGVKFELDDDKAINVIGCDGRRLAVQKIGASEVDGHEFGGNNVIVPSSGVKAIERILGLSEEAKIRITPSEIRVATESATVYSRLVEGRYPNWRQVIPEIDESYAEVSMPAGVLHNAVRQAAIVVDAESRGVDLEFTDGSLILEASTAEIGDSRVEVPVTSDLSEAKKATIDHRYLTDICKVLDPLDVLQVRVSGGTRATLIETADGYRTVVMGMAKN